MYIQYIRPQSILEMAIFTEFLIAKGYLVSELDTISPQLADSLIREASQFTANRINEILGDYHFPWVEEVQICFN